MPRGRVYIIARDIQRNDAVGNFCEQMATLLLDVGYAVQLAAENCHPLDREHIRPMPSTIADIASEDIVIFHFSTEDPSFPAVAALPNPKILYFHNITPEQFFRENDDHTADLVRQGLAQRRLCKHFDVLMANSRVSAQTLWRGLDSDDREAIKVEQVVPCPPVIGADRWNDISIDHDTHPTSPNGRLILFVGRLVPHKEVADLIAGFARLAAADSTVRLAIVGGPPESIHAAQLKLMVSELGPDIRTRIAFFSDLSDIALKRLYRDASVCTSMSRHEGFGVPLLDAIVFDKPLVIRAEPGMMETAGAAAIVVEDATPERLAFAFASALDDQKVRAQLAAARTIRLKELRRAADGHLILDAIDAARSCRDAHRVS